MVQATFLKQEFRLTLFGIDYNRPAQFVLCQWQKKLEVNIFYLIYRWLFAGYFIGSLIASIREPGSLTEASAIQFRQKWPIYLTNWAYLMYSLQAIVGAIIVTRKYLKERKLDYKFPIDTQTPWAYQLYWVLHSVSVVIALGVTVMYWAAVYDPKYNTLSTVNLMSHAFNSVFMIADFFLVSHPFRLLHFYWPVSFTIVYLSFSILYYELGGTDRRQRRFIYPVLDWQNGLKTSIVCILGLVFVMFVHFGMWVLFLIRRWLYKKCVLKEGKSDMTNDGMPHSVTSSSIHLDVTGF